MLFAAPEAPGRHHAFFEQKCVAQSRLNSTQLLALLDCADQLTSQLSLEAASRSFTQLSHLIGKPDRIHERLSDFLDLLVKNAYRCDGIVNKIMGDGIMAIFRGDSSAKRALRCAFEMLSDFGKLHADWTEAQNEDLSFLDVGVGIATDEVILGMTGNDRLRDFTVIGTAVNLAAALEWSGRDGKHVLCDNHTFVDAREIVESSEEPQRFNIGRPNQVVTHWYRVHEITALRIQHGERLQEIKPVVQPASQPHVFVSYAHKDLADVEERVVKPLERAGANVFLAATKLEAGEQWSEGIATAIRNADRVVVVVSANAVAARGLRDEINFAFAIGQNHRKDRRIVPVLLDGTSPEDLDYRLASLQYGDLRSSAGVEAFARDIQGT